VFADFAGFVEELQAMLGKLFSTSVLEVSGKYGFV
jgi:hypothetical protein